VGLSSGANLLHHKEVDGSYSHAENLHVFIDEVMQLAGITFNQLSAIAVSKGPGSYTGLRIGVSAAKGLAFALNIPLIMVDTLQAMAASMLDSTNALFLIPMIDARRMEVYTAVYNRALEMVQPIQALIVNEESASGYLNFESVALSGDGHIKCKDLFKMHPHSEFTSVLPSVKGMAVLAYGAFCDSRFEDTAYAEPYYLKEFITTSKIKS